VVRHRTYRAAAKETFPYAVYSSGDGRYAVIRKCAQFYVRGHARAHWRRWRLELFMTEEAADESMRQPCENYIDHDGMPMVLCSKKDHFVFVLPKLARDIPKPAPISVPKVEPETQGRLF
jgi:hypothetical protein